MIYLVIFFLGLLLAGNLAVSKNFLYPPALFAAVWLLSLIGLILSGDTFYPVSGETLMVFLIGAVVFSVGSLIVFSCKTVNVKRFYSSPMQISRIRRILDIVLLVVIVGFPFYWQKVMADVDLANPLFLAELRMLTVKNMESSQRSFSMVNNLVVLSIFLSMAMHYENDGTFSRKWRAYLAILFALVYSSLKGSKSGLVTIILTLTFISFIRARKMNFPAMIGVIVLGLSLFGIGLAFVNFAHMEMAATLESVRLIMETIQNYWLAGLVAFERIIQDHNSLESVHKINRFFLETANGLGANFYVPSINADYTSVSPTQNTNTYTIYFSYFKDYGWFGLMLGMSILGGLLTWIYNSALRGCPLATMFYGHIAVAIILSIRAECFFWV